MRWSATSDAPCSKSSAWPLHSSGLTSIRSIPLTIPPHCRANAAHDPTSPPPPMMLTLMFDLPTRHFTGTFQLRVASPGRAVQGVHDLVGDGLDQGIDVRSVGVAVRRGRARGRGSRGGLLGWNRAGDPRA